MRKAVKRYAGDQSKWFWNRVAKLEDDADHSGVYSLGVALQNLEHQTLTALVNAEVAQKTRRNAKAS